MVEQMQGFHYQKDNICGVNAAFVKLGHKTPSLGTRKIKLQPLCGSASAREFNVRVCSNWSLKLWLVDLLNKPITDSLERQLYFTSQETKVCGKPTVCRKTHISRAKIEQDYDGNIF